MISKAVLSLSATLAWGFAVAAEAPDYSVSQAHCTPEYWEKLPDGKKTDELIDRCDDLEPSEKGASERKGR